MDAVDVTEVVARRAARVILLDADDRILLLRAADPRHPDEPYWYTPGGGVEGDEDLLDCARRELSEETGLDLPADAFVGPVREETVDFTFEDVRYRQVQRFFLVRLAGPGGDVAPRALTALERRSWLGYRWWRVTDLGAVPGGGDGRRGPARERYYPPDLPAMLRSLGVGD